MRGREERGERRERRREEREGEGEGERVYGVGMVKLQTKLSDILEKHKFSCKS